MKTKLISICLFLLITYSGASQTVESVVTDLKSDFSKLGWTFLGEYSANTSDEIFVSSKMRTYTPGYNFALVAVAGDCRGCELQFKVVDSNDDDAYSKPTVEMKGQVIVGSMIIDFDKNTTVEIMAHINSRYSYYTKMLLYQKKK
jgi:predicted metal-binding protein